MTSRIALPVSCAGCGKCCETQAGLPVVYYRVFGTIAELPAHLQLEIQEIYVRWYGTGSWKGPADQSPCVWYDAEAKRCKHYEYRPDVCREFEVGGEACLRYKLDLH